MNGHPRDDAGLDIRAGRPTLAADLDELALRIAALLDVKRAARFWNGIEHRIRRSPAYLDWASHPHTYLQDLDSDATQAIRQDLVSTYEKVRAEAHERGWNVV